MLGRPVAREWTSQVDDGHTVSFGVLLRQYRLAAGLTQEELAERAHVSARGISDLERGARSSPRRDTLSLLAEALQLSGDERLRFEVGAQAARVRPTSSGTVTTTPNGRPKSSGANGAADSSVDQSRAARRWGAGRSSRLARLALVGLITLLLVAAVAGLVKQGSLHLNGGTSRAHDSPAVFVSWGPTRPARGTAPLHLANPLRVAVDSHGNIYVTEGNAAYAQTNLAIHRADILKLSSTGRVLAHWGRYGKRRGEFDDPAGIAVDSHDNVYVADAGNNRVQKLSPSGRVLAVWGASGTKPGQFDLPHGITVDRQGNVYVTDYLNNRIQKLSPSGEVLAVWGSACGTASRQFCAPTDVEIGPTGDIYVVENGNARLQRLSPSGRPRTIWHIPPPSLSSSAPTSTEPPTSIAIDARGNVYVLQHYGTLIHEFSAVGTQLAVWDIAVESACGCMTGLALAPDGHLVVVIGEHLYRVSLDGRSSMPYPIETRRAPARFDQPSVVATGPHGSVYVVIGAPRNRLERLSRSGRLLASWGSRAFGRSSTHDLTGAAVDARGTMYLTDALNQQVLRMAPTGRLFARWGSANGGPQQLVTPDGAAVDRQGRVYVADAATNQVDLFSPAGAPLGHWGSYGTGAREFDGPRSIAIDPRGNVYVADTGNGRIQKLSSRGHPLAVWGPSGVHSGRFGNLTGVVADRNGNVYALDAQTNQVTEISPAGTLLARWSGTRDEHSPFRRPQSIAIDDRGAVYVADTGNNRVVKLTLTPRGRPRGRQ